MITREEYPDTPLKAVQLHESAELPPITLLSKYLSIPPELLPG